MYLDPNLSVYELAKKIGTHPKKVSEIVNRIYHKNFNDYVNTYRVSEVISKIQLNEHKQVTLLGLALSCGFNSKSTFNRAFKQVTSQTPVDYIKSLK
ncbi:helix-turn-helix domain-containing protein [Penaeicola halotolerans]|uniref:helix-turn-helix domain-containing protein n=1 Tax=Penaeicola halotolerans TaxID=2793196 RepID=UPI001CF80FE6